MEDAAFLAEKNPRYEEFDRPAAHNLVYVFGFAGQALGLSGASYLQILWTGT